MAPPSTARSSSYMCGTLWLFFTLDSVQRHTRWAPSRGSIKTFRRLSLSPPLSSRINMCGGFFFFFFFSCSIRWNCEVLSISFIHRGVKEEWKWNTSAPRLMSSPLVDILFFLGSAEFHFFKSDDSFSSSWRFAYSVGMWQCRPLFSFIGYPVCSNKTFSNNRNNKKGKKLLRTKRERNKKKVLTSGGGSGWVPICQNRPLL